MSENTVKDKTYWESYYAERREPFAPSRFARYVAENFVQPGDSLIELGCGNGRDAVFLASQGIDVVAVDQCENEIAYLSETHPHPNLKFVTGDFTSLDRSRYYTNVYSRFTMHSVSVEGQAAVVDWATFVLAEGGRFLLEFRGKHNELWGKGEAVEGETDAYIYDGHYRRFLDLAETCAQLEGLGFEINESVEKSGFSPFAGDDEIFARVIATKCPT